MKKHLVMIVGGYYPNPSPTGKCAEAYVELLKDQFDISVICIAGTDRMQYAHAGKRVYPAAGWYTLFQHRLEKKAPGFVVNLAKIPVHLRQKFTQPNNLYSYVKAARKQLEKLHADRAIDVIFSVGAPMAAHVAARNFRKDHPNVRWVTYTVDSYAAQNAGSAKARAFEASVLCVSDKVLLSEEIYDNSKAMYETFAEKCSALPYLMPETPTKDVNTRYLPEDKINLVYAGRFYKDLRHPEYLLQLAMELDDGCVLHLYCQSDCDSLIDNYVQRSNGKIIRHKPVSVDTIQKIYAEADVLVSVGNNTPEFKPSKTFEYIASGKPILNIYYEGLRDEVLAQYPLSLQLQRGKPILETVPAVTQFVAQAQGKTVSRNEIDNIYYNHSSGNITQILQGALSCEKGQVTTTTHQ